MALAIHQFASLRVHKTGVGVLGMKQNAGHGRP
jgi:hypothetical protein